MRSSTPATTRSEGAKGRQRAATATRHGVRAGIAVGILPYVIRFAACWGAGLLLTSLVPGIQEMAVRATAGSLTFVLGLLGIHGTVAGSIVQLPGISLDIVPDCTPVTPTLALWSAIVAFPASLRSRLLACLAGLVVLSVYNVIRLMLLVAVMTAAPRMFEFVHVYLWQTVTLLVVFGVFGLWIRLDAGSARRA